MGQGRSRSHVCQSHNRCCQCVQGPQDLHCVSLTETVYDSSTNRKIDVEQESVRVHADVI